MRKTFDQIRAILIEGTAPAAEALSRPGKASLYLARLGLRILKQWARDRCPQQAASLAFQTTLSLVPILAIAFTVLRGAGAMNAESRLVEFLGTYVLLDPDLMEHLRDFSEKISTGAAGGLGLIFTFVTCFSLYTGVERIFNDIWRVHIRRALMRKFLTFYALVTLLPVLAGLYLYWSGKLVQSGPAARFFGPFGIQFVALLLTNKLLPNTNVKWRPAIVGTVATALMLEGTKWGFVTFAKTILLTSYKGVYGPVALVPMLLVMVYVSWVLVLLGAEIGHAIQNLKRLEVQDQRRPGDEPMNGLVAIQLLAAVAGDHERGGLGLTVDALAQGFGLAPESIERISDRLKERGLIAEVQGDKQGFIPGRAATAITVADVMAAFRSTDLEVAHGLTSEALANLIDELHDDRRQRIEGLTLADLVPHAVRRDESSAAPSRTIKSV
jgi:membrane protein